MASGKGGGGVRAAKPTHAARPRHPKEPEPIASDTLAAPIRARTLRPETLFVRRALSGSSPGLQRDRNAAQGQYR